MIVKMDDPQDPDGYVILASLQDLETLKSIFRSCLCRHNENYIDNTDEAVAIIDVVTGSCAAMWRLNFEKYVKPLRGIISKVKGLSSDLPDSLEDIKDDTCIYSISFKNIKGGIRYAYGGFGVLFRDDVGDYLGISSEKGRKMFDRIVKKD